MSITAIQSSISGYRGDPVTLLMAFNDEKNILVVSKQVALKKTLLRVSNVAISNDQSCYRDSFFSEDDLPGAISAYFSMSNRLSDDGSEKQLQFSDATRRHDPSGFIEQDGMDAAGWKYRMQEMSNGSVAVLAACFYIEKSRAISAALGFAEILKELEAGRVVTI